MERVTIRGGGLTATVVPWGAAIQDLRLDGHAAPLVLGHADPEGYRANDAYFGAIAGRYANRIASGRFTLDGVTYDLPRNFLGRHTLHGGAEGFSAREWGFAAVSEDAVTLHLSDPDGREGFPGQLDASVTYSVGGEGVLRVSIEACADRATVCNLAQHSYFNLEDGGASDCRAHRMAIFAESYLPVDEELIPTGAVAPVMGTDFDFRAEREIGASRGGCFDHNFCLSLARGDLRLAARARAPRSGVELEVWTTEPGVQFYSGEYVRAGGEGLDGVRYAAHSGFCLEPQVWPDAPNRPDFPQAVLREGEVYRQETEFRFGKG